MYIFRRVCLCLRSTLRLGCQYFGPFYRRLRLVFYLLYQYLGWVRCDIWGRQGLHHPVHRFWILYPILVHWDGIRHWVAWWFPAVILLQVRFAMRADPVVWSRSLSLKTRCVGRISRGVGQFCQTLFWRWSGKSRVCFWLGYGRRLVPAEIGCKDYFILHLYHIVWDSLAGLFDIKTCRWRDSHTPGTSYPTTDWLAPGMHSLVPLCTGPS